MDDHKVKVGDDEYTIGRFRGFKAVEATRLLGQMAASIPEIEEAMLAFKKRYRDANVIELSRAAAEAQFGPAAKRISNSAWKASDNKIEMTEDPSFMETIASVFPMIFEAAEKDSVRLIALILAPDRDLEEADEKNAVGEYIDKAAKRLLHRGYLDELIPVATEAISVLNEQMAGKGPAVTSLAMMVMRQVAALRDQAPAPVATSETSSKPPSSTDSEPPTDGPDEKPSTATSGERSSASSTG